VAVGGGVVTVEEVAGNSVSRARIERATRCLKGSCSTD
jgi:hypothetical protein